MITHYAQKMSGWKDWQKAYRYGAILVIPPDPPFTEVTGLREKYDPVGCLVIGAHISLTVPLAREVTEDDWKELINNASVFKPFTVNYGPVFNVLPAAPGVMLRIEPKDVCENIVTALEKGDVFQGSPARSFNFYPHMTIAEYVDKEQTEILTEQLKDTSPSGSFLCSYLSYAVPDESFQFTERVRLELGK
jgi:hypothetical protein